MTEEVLSVKEFMITLVNMLDTAEESLLYEIADSDQDDFAEVASQTKTLKEYIDENYSNCRCKQVIYK